MRDERKERETKQHNSMGNMVQEGLNAQNNESVKNSPQ